MQHSTLRALPQPEDKPTDLLTDLLRAGVRDLIAHAVEAELQALFEHHGQCKHPDGRQAVVRNGYLPERIIQTAIGDIEIKVPKVATEAAPASALTAHCYCPISSVPAV